MKIFEDKKIRLVCLTLLLTLLSVWSKNGQDSILIVFAQCIITWMILWTVYSMLIDRFRRSEEQVKGFVAKFIMRVFGPAFRKLLYGSVRKSNYVIGSDKKEYIGTIAIFSKGKKKSRRLKKIEVDSCEDNSDKIRLLYVKYILKAVKKGRDVLYSQTPAEIKHELSSDGGETLFDSYEHVRYSKDATVDDATVEMCKKITGEY